MNLEKYINSYTIMNLENYITEAISRGRHKAKYDVDFDSIEIGDRVQVKPEKEIMDMAKLDRSDMAYKIMHTTPEGKQFPITVTFNMLECCGKVFIVSNLDKRHGFIWLREYKGDDNEVGRWAWTIELLDV
jgi:hypothetical protein